MGGNMGGEKEGNEIEIENKVKVQEIKRKKGL
jgi:hypothetical protein